MSSTPKSKSNLKLKAKVAAPFSTLMAWSIIPSMQASTMTISSACHSKARLMRPSKRKRYQVQSMPKAPGGRGRPDFGRAGGEGGFDGAARLVILRCEACGAEHRRGSLEG